MGRMNSQRHPLFDATLSLLQELIRNACVNDFTPGSGQEVRNADTLEAFFRQSSPEALARMTISRIEPEPGRTTLVVRVKPTESTSSEAKPLSFFGHTDVVVVDEDAWTRPCFDAVIEDGVLYGRGAVDMLFITAVQAVVTRWAAHHPLRRAVCFAGLADEEARGSLGAGWIARHQPEALDWDYCLGETGGSHIIRDGSARGIVVNAGEKGAAQRRIHVTGDAGHASAPWGKTLTTQLLGEVTARLSQLRIPCHQPLWEKFVTSFAFDPDTEAAFLAHGETDPDYGVWGDVASFAHAMSHTTVAPTVVQAGGPINVLPSSGYVELDIRPTPGMSQDEIDAVLNEALGELAPHCRIERLICEDSTVSPTDTALFRAITDTLGELFPGEPVIPIVTTGGSDLRFARKRGGVAYGFAAHAPQRSIAEAHAQLHAHDEHLHLEDLDLTLRAYLGVVERFAGGVNTVDSSASERLD